MKRLIFLLLVFLLVSCKSQTIQSPTVEMTNTSNPVRTRTSTVETETPPALQATQLPTIQSTPALTLSPTANPAMATLIAASPSITIAFDGNECKIPSSTEIQAGEHVLLLKNQSGKRTLLWIGRIYPGKVWEDYLQFFETNCGPPGSNCLGSGEPEWIAWVLEEKSTGLDTTEGRYQHQLNIKGNYLIVAQQTVGNTWPCGTFQVTTP